MKPVQHQQHQQKITSLREMKQMVYAEYQSKDVQNIFEMIF
jgi:hypothetical protein